MIDVSSGNELIPLKRILKVCDVSRATLWRVSRGVKGFPEATTKGRRLFWREDEIEALKRAIATFEGRTAFDRARKTERRHAEARHHSLAAMKQVKLRGRRTRPSPKKPKQGDLFSV